MVMNMRAKKIFCVVAYDISDDKRRNKVARILTRHGKRINNSVFECMFTDVQFKKTKEQIAKLIDRDDDSVAYYPICVGCFTKAVYQPERRSNDRLVMVL